MLRHKKKFCEVNYIKGRAHWQFQTWVKLC